MCVSLRPSSSFCVQSDASEFDVVSLLEHNFCHLYKLWLKEAAFSFVVLKSCDAVTGRYLEDTEQTCGLSVSFQNSLFTLKRRRQVHTLRIYRRFRSDVFFDKYINKIIRLEWNGNCFLTPYNGYNWAKHILLKHKIIKKC